MATAVLTAMPPSGPPRLGPQPEALGAETLLSAAPRPSTPPSTTSHASLAVPGPTSGSVGHQGNQTNGVLRPALPSHMIGGAPSVSTSDSGSICSTSAHSASIHSTRNISNLFGRRGSNAAQQQDNGKRPKSTRSTGSGRSKRSKSGRSAVDSTLSSAYVDGVEGDDALEMVPMPPRSHGKRRLVQEHHEARIDRRKAEAAVSKWRKWIVEQPDPAQSVDANPLYTSATPPTFRSEHQRLRSPESTPTPTPPSTIGRSGAGSHLEPLATLSSRSSVAGPSTHRGAPSPSWNAEGGPSSSDSSHLAVPGTPRSTLTASLVPGAQDIYTTESVRMLRDVELAVDPEFLGAAAVSPLARQRRLSTRPRICDMENPFASIDSLISRRGIRPLVLELVQSLGIFIDAVWCTTFPGRPCPWAAVPVSNAARRNPASATAKITRTWRSWTLAAVQEAKRRGFVSSSPTEADVVFWGWEIRYGLRDIDEAINRRKDLGWAFGETVIRGEYGDIVPTNVLLADGGGGNIARLLNDLEEALWGDAIPAPTDVAFEHDASFDPFSVYREGDELIGVEHQKPIEVRDAELRQVFGDAYPGQKNSSTLPSPRSPTSPFQPRRPSGPYSPDRGSFASTLSSSPTSRHGATSSPRTRSQPSPVTPADPTAPPATHMSSDLDFSVLTGLEELSVTEKLELGRRRHQEYLERKHRLAPDSTV